MTRDNRSAHPACGVLSAASPSVTRSAADLLLLRTVHSHLADSLHSETGHVASPVLHSFPNLSRAPGKGTFSVPFRTRSELSSHVGRMAMDSTGNAYFSFRNNDCSR